MITRSRSVGSKHPSRVVAVEPLENRRLLSASFFGWGGFGGGRCGGGGSGGGGGGGGPTVATAAVTDGLLHVVGTRNADLIVIGMNYADPSGMPKVDVSVNNAVIGSFLLQDVTQGVQVNAGKGDDTVRFDESAGLVPLGLRAYGEAGNDTLVGSFLDDELYGGAGADSLYGNDGNDSLYGEDGDDLLAGGGGDDLLDGGKNNDSLYGEAGADLLLGGDGVDLVDAGDGDDSLDGGLGADSITGGSGPDLFAATDAPSEVLDKTDEDTHDYVAPATTTTSKKPGADKGNKGGKGHHWGWDDLFRFGKRHHGR